MAAYQEGTSGTLPFYNDAMQNLLNKGQQVQEAQMWAQLPQQSVAGFSPLQQQAFNLTQQNVGNYQPALNGAYGALTNIYNQYGSLFGQGNNYYDPDTARAAADMRNAGAPQYAAAQQMFQQGAQFDPNQLSQYMNPYTQNVVGEVGRLGAEQFANSVAPTLRNNFNSLGQYGSARQASMLSQAAAQNQREVLGQQGQLLNTGYQNAMGNYLDWAKQKQASGQNMVNLGAQQYNQVAGANNFAEGVYQNAVDSSLAAAQAKANGLQQQGAGLGNLAQAQQQLGLGDVGALATNGATQQQLAQKQADLPFLNWQQQQQYPWQQLNNWANLFKAGTPQQNTSWNTSFKEGGLARASRKYAEGGIIEDLIEQGIAPSQRMAEDAMSMRKDFFDQARSLPELQPLEERPLTSRLGEAMMRASAQGPAHWGQLIGRSGAAFYDGEKAIEDENKARAVAREGLAAKALTNIHVPTIPGLGSAIKAAGGPSPEQLRTVYVAARNEAAQIAKDHDWKDPQLRETWIQQQANNAVQNYVDQWTTRPTGPRGTEPPAPQAPAPVAAAPTAPATPASAPKTAGKGPVPTFNFRIDDLNPEDRTAMDALVAQLSPDGNNSVDIMRQMNEIAKKYPSAAKAPAKAAPAPIVSPPPKDKVRLAMDTSAGKAVGEAAGEDFKAVQTAATAAQEQWNAFSQLEKLDPYTNKFTNVYANAGEALSALGQDPNSTVIQNAIKNKEAATILNQLRNASLKAEKGVQTASDEKRISAELPNTNDLGQVWTFSVKLGKERAQRKLDQNEFYQNAASNSGGRVGTVNTQFMKQYQNDPLTQYLGGKLVFRSDFLNSYQRKYPDATKEDAVNEWRAMEQDFINRGGKK